MNWLYNAGGASHEITLRPYVPIVDGVYDGKYVVIRHDGQTLYTPLTPTNGEPASDIRVRFHGQTYAVSKNPDLLMNRSRPRAATECTLIADKFDFGIDGGDGKDYYTNMTYITATRPNSTIYGNINSNTITLAGGEENLLAGGMGKDTFVLRGEDALIVDFGVGDVTKLADGTELITASDYANYNRFDTGTYMQGNCVLEIYGTVTGIYFDGSATGVNKYYGVVDVAVVYDNAHVVLLKNVLKAYTKASDTPSSRLWKNNVQNLTELKIADCSASDTPEMLSNAQINALFADWADFPVELRPKLIRLYQMYDESDFTCSAVDLEVNHQVLPDDLRYPTRDDSPIDMLDGRTLNGIKNIFNKGLGSKYFRVGDYFDITFPTAVTLTLGSIPADSTWRAVCLGIDHNPEIEGYNRGHFCIGRNTDNVEIAFASRRMNATGTNAGGWAASEMRTFLNSTFYNALPTDLKAVISPCTKYTDNVGNASGNDIGNITATQDNIWLPAEYECRGSSYRANAYEKNFQKLYDYYQNGNSVIHFNFTNTTSAVQWWLRSPTLTDYQFCLTNGNGTFNRNYASKGVGFVPCFTIGGDSD